mgnify:FL=1
MRVNVIYSSELDHVPDEVSEMLGLQARKLKQLSVQLQEACAVHLNSGNHNACLERIHALRIDMAKLDIRLDECVNILNEWHKVKVTMSEAVQNKNEIETSNETQEGGEHVQ